jgi:hypothetical protein
MRNALATLERSTDDGDFSDSEITARWEAYRIIEAAQADITENYIPHLDGFEHLRALGDLPKVTPENF